MSKRRKLSKAANLQRRINQVVNGMSEAGPKSPVFVIKNGKMRKLSRAEYERLEEKAESLSYFAGGQIRPEDLLK